MCGGSTRSSPPPIRGSSTPSPRTRPTARTRYRAGSRRPEELRAGHLPAGAFTANAAWLVLAVIASNLTRAAASLTEPHLAKATTATIRRKLIAVPSRVAHSGRQITLPCPPRGHGRPPGRPCSAGSATRHQPAATAARPQDHSGTPGQQGPTDHHVLHNLARQRPAQTITARQSVDPG